MERRRSGGSVGLASVLMIVMVLALTCFGVLALASARADGAVSARAAQFSADYYAAEGRLQQQLAQLDGQLQAGAFSQSGGTLLKTLTEPLDGERRLVMELAVTPALGQYRVLSCGLVHTGSGSLTARQSFGMEANNRTMEIKQILETALQRESSDVFIVPGAPVHLKAKGEMLRLDETRVLPPDSELLIRQIYALAERSIEVLLAEGDDDFSFSMRGLGRFRCNAYKQRSSLAAVIRVVTFGLPDPEEMHIPAKVMDLYSTKNGMILVTGSAGSGKSTTLACLIDRINREKSGHIITLEDPIEYVHSHQKCLVSQREISHDTESYAAALRAALRQTPNVILLGEMRDFETIQTAITAAETGQLLLSTLHTVGAAKTIDRIIDVFPAHQQAQVRIQLSMVLRAVVSQQLVPLKEGGLEPVFEVMRVTPAIQSMIRDGKTFQIDNVIYSGADAGMQTMDGDIFRLYKAGRITRDIALAYAVNPETLARRL